jgi:formylglycine-generating enzyme required for sulfatase activity
MKSKTLLILAILALATLSCGLSSGLLGGDGDDATEPPAGASSSSGSEGADVGIADLDTLDSYRLLMKWQAQNEDSSEGFSMIIQEEWVREPPARHLTMSGAELGGEEPVPMFEMIGIGDSTWMKARDTWVQMEADQAEGMTDAWPGLMTDVQGWTSTGTETVNGVRCKRYTADEKTQVSFAIPEEGGTVQLQVEGDTWVADEPGLPPVTIRQRVQIEGGFFPLAALVPGAGAPSSEDSAVMNMEYDVTDINASITINPPGDVSDIPLVPPAGETPGAQPPGGETPGAIPDLPPPPAETQTKARPADGMTMIYIPAGQFVMGDDASAFAPERPAHLVFLTDYWIDKTEVTNAQYRLCVQAGVCTPPPAFDNPDLNGDQQPALVPWSGAQAYCQWVGGRLPTEAEWEKAARGTDARLWPWGHQFEDGRANLSGDTDGYGFTAPVGVFPAGASPYSLLDMAGNAAEWVADWYDAAYYAQSPAQNPTGPAVGEEKVVRSTIANGGGGPEKCRTVARYPAPPEHPRWHYGFRCASTTQP